MLKFRYSIDISNKLKRNHPTVKEFGMNLKALYECLCEGYHGEVLGGWGPRWGRGGVSRAKRELGSRGILQGSWMSAASPP